MEKMQSKMYDYICETPVVTRVMYGIIALGIIGSLLGVL